MVVHANETGCSDSFSHLWGYFLKQFIVVVMCYVLFVGFECHRM